MNQKLKYQSCNLGNYIIPIDTRGGVCIDIGANVGSFLKKYFQFFDKIYFYEPQNYCYNICQSLKFKNIIGYKEAVYNKSGCKLKLLAHKNYDSGSSAIKTDVINEDWSNNIIEEVISVDLETVLQRAGSKVDYMKIDIETGEYHFLMYKDLKPIKYIGMEIHWQMGKLKWNELFKYITESHYLIGNSTWHKNKNKEVLFVSKESVSLYNFLKLKITKQYLRYFRFWLIRILKKI